MIRYFRLFFTETWAVTEKTSIETHSVFHKQFINISSLVIIIYIAVGLSIVKYFGDINSILLYVVGNKFSINDQLGSFKTWFCCFFYGSGTGVFHQKIWWVSIIVFMYLIIPVLIIKLIFKQPLSDYGLRFKNIHKDYPLYVLMLLIMFPVVYFASTTPAFQDRYPLFKPVTESMFSLFFWWQIAYFIQFIAVEFFFRGFILHGLKSRFGFYSIFISMVPYCMVHFGKPFGETIAAIFAGVILGTLSLKSRSIILGIMIHYSIALMMDVFALYREGLLK
jgi:uncharacterized protein